MRKATHQVGTVVEAVFYAANQSAFYRTTFRLWSMVCPFGGQGTDVITGRIRVLPQNGRFLCEFFWLHQKKKKTF